MNRRQKEQIIESFKRMANDVIHNRVKLGIYEYGKYVIGIGKKHTNEGLCIKCGKKAVVNQYGHSTIYCKEHQKESDEHQTKRRK